MHCLADSHRVAFGGRDIRIQAGLLLVACWALPQAATAACAAGDWVGTIGETPAAWRLATTEHADREASVGRYYYRRALKELYLRVDAADPTTWRETDEKGRATGSLTLDCRADALSGMWRSPDGRKTLPLRARPAGANDGYDERRTRGLRPDTATTKVVDDRYYDQIGHAGVDGVSTVSLWGEGAGIARINASLWREAVDAMALSLACTGDGRMWRGVGHPFEYGWDQSVAAWNTRYVVIGTSQGGYCGGAHPTYGTSTAVYATETGQEVAVDQWLLPAHRQDIDARSMLGRMIIGLYLSKEDGETECLDRIAISGRRMHPERQGLVFEVDGRAYVDTPCARSVTVPWAQAVAFLSPEGIEAAKAFR
ncbi:hypothetical protein CDN99_21700 [Roseateles aquatilis]|uniref:Uncharacterized protein n=1 Tax=Roseateles aquatilis TaxID=431061 RepID=A0A246IZE9_9BURK|nr:hypothetical protein [Roseateles aquatilis]OWQ85695.1 hypothetical protein CDN99_21700 [Roseateles aquatilis]